MNYPTPGARSPRVRVTDAAGARRRDRRARGRQRPAAGGPAAAHRSRGRARSHRLPAGVRDGQRRRGRHDPVPVDLDGDGNFERDGGTAGPGEGATIETTFATRHAFVGVRAIDADGGEGDTLMQVDVAENRPPAISLVPDAASVRAGRELGFLVQGADPDAAGGTVKVAWDDGGGTFGPVETVSLPVSRDHLPGRGPPHRARARRGRGLDGRRGGDRRRGQRRARRVAAREPESPAAGDRCSSTPRCPRIPTARSPATAGTSTATARTSSTAAARRSCRPRRTAGTRRFGVQVTDDDGATATTTRDVTVRPDDDGGGTPERVAAGGAGGPATTGGGRERAARRLGVLRSGRRHHPLRVGSGRGRRVRARRRRPADGHRSHAGPGHATFGVRVTDDGGATSVATRQVTVAKYSGAAAVGPGGRDHA